MVTDEGVSKQFPLSDVRDINDVLELTVYDEDKEHKYEFLGKVIFIKIYYLCKNGFVDYDSSNED